MLSINTIFDKYNTDKNSSFHNYSRQYDTLFKEFRDKPIKFLEIGVLTGESMKAWREVFPNAKTIVGLDIDPRCKMYENTKSNIFIEIANASDKARMEYMNEKYGGFDIIIDDGSHTNIDVINAFESLFPLLNNHGLYVVEDVICYKHDQSINPEYPNHIDYFTKFIPFLNQWRFDSTSGIQDNCVDPFKIQKKTTNVFEYSIDKIEFGCSYIGIYKNVRTHWIKN